MKAYILVIIILSLSGIATAKSKKERLQNIGAKLSTDHSFKGLNVNGRYQSAFEGLSTVENEKPILDILDYPKNYDGRLKASKKWIR
jgi:hypothetical protein